MGGSSSKEDEVNLVDTNGQVNNNIIIQEAKDTHEQLKMSESLLFATYFICVCELIKIFIYLLNAYNKKMKKRYQQNGQP